MSEAHPIHERPKPWRLTTKGKLAAGALVMLSAVGAKDTGQGILNYVHSRTTPHYVDVDARVGEDGGTIWEIARKAQPEGDISPLVGRLVDEHGGIDTVQPNEQLTIRSGHLVKPEQPPSS